MLAEVTRLRRAAPGCAVTGQLRRFDGNGDGDGDGDGDPVLGTLAFSCEIPFILDGMKLEDLRYMSAHFDDLIQSYCATGVLGDTDVTQFPEKLHSVGHRPGELGFLQTSMNSSLEPQWAVRMLFTPDSSVMTGVDGSVSPPSTPSPLITVSLLDFVSTPSACVRAVGARGTIEVVDAVGVTMNEGGSIAFTGTADMIAVKPEHPWCLDPPWAEQCCPP